MNAKSKFFTLIVLVSLFFSSFETIFTTPEFIKAGEADFAKPELIQMIGSMRDETLIDLDQNVAGSFAIVGTTDGDIDGHSNRQLDAFVAKFDSEGKKQWLVRFGTPQDDYATAVAIDDVGTVWVSGDTYGGMEGNVNKGERDGFLAKFSSTGVQQWIVHISTDVVERARGLAVDSRGVATVVGTTYGEFLGFSNFGKSREAWITQIDSFGNRLWLQEFGTENADTIVDVEVDSDGNSTFCGYTDGAIGSQSFGGRDAFVGTFTNTGSRGWTYQLGTVGTDICYGLTVNSLGEIFAVGNTSGSFGSSTNSGMQDGWILKLSATGVRQWLSQVGSSGDDSFEKVEINKAGQVIAGGSSTGNFGSALNSGATDAILIIVDSSGKTLSTRLIGTELSDSIAGIAVTNSQKIIIAGTVGKGIFGETGLGELDVFVARFAPLNATPSTVTKRSIRCKKLKVVKTLVGPKVVCPAGFKRLVGK